MLCFSDMSICIFSINVQAQQLFHKVGKAILLKGCTHAEIIYTNKQMMNLINIHKLLIHPISMATYNNDR